MKVLPNVRHACPCLQYREEATEAQRGEVTCPGLHRRERGQVEAVGAGLEPLPAHALNHQVPH